MFLKFPLEIEAWGDS